MLLPLSIAGRQHAPPLSQVVALLHTAAVVFVAAPVRADNEDVADQANRYLVTPLVSNNQAPLPSKIQTSGNAWGVAFSPAGSPFWVADNAAGLSFSITATVRSQPAGGVSGQDPRTAVPGTNPDRHCFEPTTGFLVFRDANAGRVYL